MSKKINRNKHRLQQLKTFGSFLAVWFVQIAPDPHKFWLYLEFYFCIFIVFTRRTTPVYGLRIAYNLNVIIIKNLLALNNTNEFYSAMSHINRNGQHQKQSKLTIID